MKISMQELIEKHGDEELRITAEDLTDIAAGGLMTFAEECLDVAKKNWTPAQCLQLEWLFGAVLEGKEYAEYAEEQMEEQDNGSSDDM